MNVRVGKKLNLQPLQLQVNEHGLIMLNIQRRPSRALVELPANATLMQTLKAQMERLIDYLFAV